MRDRSDASPVAYGAAVLATGISLLARWPLWSLLGTSSPFLTFVPAVIFAAYFGGLWPGLLATLLSAAVANYYLVEPFHSLRISNVTNAVALILFLLIGSLISILCESLHRTKRRLVAEEKIRADRLTGESEERFRGTFENAAVGIAHEDLTGRFSRVNERFCAILGYPYDELVGKTFSEVTHTSDLAADLAQFGPLSRGEASSYTMEKRFVRKDGTIVWADLTVSLRFDEAGKPSYCIKIIQDITERKRLETQLCQAHTRLELAVRGSNITIFELNMPDGVLENSRWDLVSVVEQASYNNSEFPTDFATGMAYTHPDDRERVERAIRAYLSGQTREFELESWARNKDGSYRWLLTRGVVVRDEEGKAVRLMGTSIDITELKQAEEALRTSEHRFRTFVDHASDAFFLLDERGLILDVNRRACQSLGYTRAELVGMTPIELDADVAHHDLADIEQRLNAGETIAFESKHRRRVGTVFPVEVRAQAFWEGARRFTVALARDITDRKRDEEALRLSEQRYRSLVEATAAIVWTLPPSGLADESEQPSWSAFTGQSKEQLPGWGWLEAVHPDDQDHTRQLWSTAVATRTLYQLEYRLRRYDGEYRNLLTRGVPIVAADGELREWFGICVDITDLKRAEESLRESEERFRGTFENAAVGIAHLDAQGRCLRANEKLAEIFCYPQSDLIGTTIQDVVYPDDLAANLALFVPLMNGDIPSFTMEKRVVRKDGSIVWAYVTVSLQRDAKGKPAYCIAIVQNISQRKRLEEELRQAKEVAEAANRSKDEFLANVSHEIRTPMNAILGMTDLTLDTPLTAEQRQYLKTVKSAADSLLNIINDLLDFSKIEAGKLELDPADFSLREMVGDAVRTLAMRAHRKGLELVSKVQPDLPDALVGDAGRVRQILLNLVANAIKFTEKGEVVVRVAAAAEPTSDGKTCLRFSVRDTGIGISSDKQATVFQAFEQEDASTTRKYGGTGLGLTIAARLVALMGGTISVESELGRGSTFTFTAKFGRQTRSPEPVASRPPHQLFGLRVLIVDDNATNRRILEEWLSGWDMEPVSRGDGLTALDALWHGAANGRPYELVLLDSRMPDTDGLTLAATIRERAELAATHIILLTSGERPDGLARLHELRIDTQLLKPVQQEELLQAIYQVMGRRKSDARRSVRLESDSVPAVAPLHILVAEDNEFNAQLLMHVLARHGHDVRLANNGREALNLAAGGYFDLLLLDVHMPELDGFEVVRAIRELEQTSGGRLPVIALTARSRRVDRERCLAAGMDDFLSKPVRPADLWAAIERICDTRSTAERPGADLIDPRVLLATCGSDAGMLEQLSRAFRSRLPELLAAVQEALRDRDAPRLSEAAHKLCGMLSVFSSVASDVASDLEDLAAIGRIEECEPLLERLNRMAIDLLQRLDGLSVEALSQE